ncbi:MAG: DUF4131 domain-containing protein, partial [Alphaproteobacteria bacterium]
MDGEHSLQPVGRAPAPTWLDRALVRPLVLLLDERERWPLWLPVLFGLGISIYFALGEEPPLWPAALVSLAGFAASVPLRRFQWPFIAVLSLAMVAAGFSVVRLRTLWLSGPVLEGELGPLTVVGRVVEIEARPGGWRAVLDRVRAERPAEHPRLPARVRLGGRGSEPDGGSWIRARAVLLPPPAPAAPGAYDFQRQAYFERLGAVGYTL